MRPHQIYLYIYLAMTRAQFIEYLHAPEKLNGHSIDALEKLVREYPYCQTAHLLYLKNLHNQNSIDYEKQLRIASAYASSRKVLYNLIKKKTDDRRQAADVKPEVEASVILPKEEPIVILQEEIILQQEIIRQLTDETETSILEKEILREAYRSAPYQFLSTEKLQEEKKDIHTEAHSFTDWLKVISGETPTEKIPTRQVSKEKKNELIQKFILEEVSKPSLEKPKAEFYSPEEMAKKSLQDDEQFVTETLAKIYLRQGNLPKALRAYEILLLKHPEKNLIFAPLLEKIKKLLWEQKGK